MALSVPTITVAVPLICRIAISLVSSFFLLHHLADTTEFTGLWTVASPPVSERQIVAIA